MISLQLAGVGLIMIVASFVSARRRPILLLGIPFGILVMIAVLPFLLHESLAGVTGGDSRRAEEPMTTMEEPVPTTVVDGSVVREVCLGGLAWLSQEDANGGNVLTQILVPGRYGAAAPKTCAEGRKDDAR